MRFSGLILFSLVFILSACGQYREKVTGVPSVAKNNFQDNTEEPRRLEPARQALPTGARAPGNPVAEPEPRNLPAGTTTTTILPLSGAATTTTTTTTTVAPLSTEKPVFLESGMLIPTIYYLPVVYNDLEYCLPKNKVPVINTRGQVITKMCYQHYKDCALQGSCVVVEKDQRMRISVSTVRLGVTIFSRVAETSCPNGQTGGGICVDPFHSLAADLSIYKLGDVIFVPSLVGVKLPDETSHTGYFIVRDTGSAIKGKGRFDFYTGYYGINDARNVFVKYQLGDKNTRLPYYKVADSVATKVRVARRYPY